MFAAFSWPWMCRSIPVSCLRNLEGFCSPFLGPQPWVLLCHRSNCSKQNDWTRTCLRDLPMVLSCLPGCILFSTYVDWNLCAFLQVYHGWEVEGVCPLCLDGLDLFTRAADRRESSAKYLEYVLDSPASEELPGAGLSLHSILGCSCLPDA